MGFSRRAHRAQNVPIAQQGIRTDAWGDLTWRFPPRTFGDHEKIAGPALCERCHAYLETDHWRYGEQRYRELQGQADVHTTLCPGCHRVERRLYEGEVIVHHGWDRVDKGEVLNMIHNVEAQVRVANPAARIALLEDRGDEVYLLTTTQFLAERIGKELRKSYQGTLVLDSLPRERFTRVRWTRE